MKWPRTLASRLALIFFTGLVLAYGLSFGLQAYERYISSRSMMLSNLEQDVATSVAILDRLPAAERAAWLPRLAAAQAIATLAVDEGAKFELEFKIP